MEYGYDVEFPRLYERNRFNSRNSYSSNRLLSNKSVQEDYRSNLLHEKLRQYRTKNYLQNPKKEDNQLSNLSTIVPNITSSNTNILELETLVTKKSVSPYKNIKLPSLVSKKMLPRVSENPKSKRANLEISSYSSTSKHSKYSKMALDMTSQIDYEKVVEETSTLNELVILTLSHAFGARPKQAAGIVPHSFKFLTVVVVKAERKESK